MDQIGQVMTRHSDKKQKLQLEQAKRRKAAHLRRAKKDRRMSETALIRFAAMLPRDLRHLIFRDHLGWDMQTDIRVVILESLQSSPIGKAIVKEAYTTRIKSRLQLKAARKVLKKAKKAKGLPIRSPHGVGNTGP